MSQTYYLSFQNSDLSVSGASFNRQLVKTTEPASTISVPVLRNTTVTGYAFTDALDPGVEWDLDGDLTIEINVTTANSNGRVGAGFDVISDTGVVRASTWTDTFQSAGTTGVKSFTSNNAQLRGEAWSPFFGGSFTSVAHGNGLYLAAQFSTGWIFRSSDLVNWDISFVDMPEINGVACGIGQGLNPAYVAVGRKFGSGAIFFSPDGVNWSERNIGTTSTLKDVAYGRLPNGNDRFVAVGGGNSAGQAVIWFSSDGFNWVPRSAGNNFSLDAVTYANGLFVAVGNSGNQGAIFTSPDGDTWNSRASGVSASLSGVTYGNGTYMAVGSSTDTVAVTVSTNGQNWTGSTFSVQHPDTQLTIDPRIQGVFFGDGVFVMLGRQVGIADPTISGLVMTSPNGNDWVVRQASSFPDARDGIYVDGKYLAATGSGLRVNSLYTAQPTDRIRVNYRFRNTAAHADFTLVVEAGTTNTEVIVPLKERVLRKIQNFLFWFV